MNAKDLKSFIESNKELLDELESLALKFSLNADDSDLIADLKSCLDSISDQAGRFDLARLDAVAELFSQLFELKLDNAIYFNDQSKDIISSGMEIIFKNLLEDEDIDILNAALQEVEDSLTLILSGDSLEIPPALLDDDIHVVTVKSDSYEIPSEYKSFCNEALEQLTSIPEIIADFDEDYDTALSDLKIIFHNIHGNSKYLGFTKISNLSAANESLINIFIKSGLVPDQEFKAIILQSRDLLSSLVNDILSNKSELTSITLIMNQVNSLISTIQEEEEKLESVKEREEFAATVSDSSLHPKADSDSVAEPEESGNLEIEYLEEFFVEAVDHLSDIESRLLKIEENSSGDTIHSMLNSFHSIKGSSQYIGLQKIGTLAHKAENILDSIRKGNIEVNSDVVEVLLQTIDHIRRLMKEVEKHKTEKLDISKLNEWLDKLEKGHTLKPRETSEEAAGKTRQEETELISPSKLEKEEFDIEELPPADLLDDEKIYTAVPDSDDMSVDLQIFRDEFEKQYDIIISILNSISEKSFDKSSFELLLSQIHSIKGSAAYVPSPSISNVLIVLENLLKETYDHEIVISGTLLNKISEQLKEIRNIVFDDVRISEDFDTKYITDSLKKAFEQNKKDTAESFDELPSDDFGDIDEPEEDMFEIPESALAVDDENMDEIILGVKGFGKRFLKNIKKAGFDTTDKLKSASLDQLLDIKGVNLKKAQQIKELFSSKGHLSSTDKIPPIPSLEITGKKVISSSIDNMKDIPTEDDFTAPVTEAEKKALRKEYIEPVDISNFSPIVDNDYDRELIGIYLDTANEYLSNCTIAIAKIDELGRFSQQELNTIRTNLSNLFSSSNYMEYTQLCELINKILQEFDDYIESDDVTGFLSHFGSRIETLSKLLPYLEAPEEVPAKEFQVISANLDQSKEDDEELISIFVNAAEKNVNEIQKVIKLIKQDKVDPESMSNLYSNLNNLQLSANFLGFENLYDVIDDAKGVANQLHDDEERLNINRVTKLQDHLDHIIIEVDKIKSGTVHEFAPDAFSAPLEEAVHKVRPVVKEEQKTSVDVSAEIAETQIKKHIEEKIQQAAPEEPERTKTSAEKIQESLTPGSAPIEIEEIAPKTLRVDIDRINDLLNMTSEMVLNRAVFTQLSLDYSRFYDYLTDNKRLSRSELQTLRNLISSFELNVESLGRATNLLQDGVMKIRLVPINLLFRKIPRIVRDLSIKTGKKVRIEFKGEETELDRTVIEKISDPIIHILRNAVDHGIELPEIRKKLGKPPIGTVTCSSYYEGDIVVVEISDDGVGIDVEKIKERVKELKILDERDLDKFTDSDLLELIFFPGFSTSKSVTDTSGRGVGMDVVRDNISKLGGTVTISSDKDKGTTITMRIPLTLAIIKTLLVKISALVYAIPVASISETIKINTNEINFVEEEEVINFRDKVIPLIRLDNIFTFPVTTPFPETNASNTENSEFFSHLDRVTEQTQLGDSASLAENEIYIVVLQVGEKEFGLHVNALIGEQDIVIENLDDTLVHSQGISGAAILGDGTIALTMDVIELTKLSVEREQAKSKLAKHVLIDQIRQETGLNTRENGK